MFSRVCVISTVILAWFALPNWSNATTFSISYDLPTNPHSVLYHHRQLLTSRLLSPHFVERLQIGPDALTLTATGNTETLQISDISLSFDGSGLDSVSIIGRTFDVTRRYTIDPPGFEPPFVQPETIENLSLQSQLDIAFGGILPVPDTIDIDPVTLRTEAIPIFSVSFLNRSDSLFVDGVLHASQSPQDVIDVMVGVFFSCGGTSTSPFCTPLLRSIGPITIDESEFSVDELFGPPPDNTIGFTQDVDRARIRHAFVPEPGTWILLTGGLTGLLAIARRQRAT